MTVTEYLATPPQRALFSEYERHPGNDAFDLVFLFRLDGAVDGTRLTEAIRRGVLASPGLRTTFHRCGVQVQARVQPPGADVTHEALPGHGDHETWARAQVDLDRGCRLEPDNPCPIRVRVWSAPEVTYLYVRASHLVSDAYSFYAGVGTWTRLYAAADEDWDTILAESATLHPGNVPPVAAVGHAVDAYAVLLDSVTSVTHDVLRTPRTQGRILGPNTFVRLSGPFAATLRSSWVAQTYGLATTFFSAYAAVLQRLEGRPDVVLGVPLAGRAGHQAKRAIGFFVNTLPLPVHVDPSTTWGELCHAVHSGVRTLQGCQGLDPNSPAARPLFPDDGWAPDNAVTFYKQGLVLTLPGVQATSLRLERSGLTYPFTVNVADLGDDIDVEVCVHAGLAEVPVAALLQEALEELVSGPENPVIDGRLLDPPHCPGPPTVARQTLTELVAAAVTAHADRIAVSDPIEDLTYAQLWARAGVLATHLEETRATPYVLVKSAKSADTVAALLGVLLSGRAYVPLDPDGAPEREGLIRQRVAAAQGAEPTQIGGARATTAQVRPARPRPAMSPVDSEAPAYVIFTSGSTGEPKGVVIPHGNVADLLASTVNRFQLGPDDTWSLFHSLAFDFSVWEVFGALTTGARLVIPPPEVVRDPATTTSWLTAHGVTVLNQTPSAFRRLSPTLSTSSALADVRLIVFGGEACYPSDLEPWWQVAGSRARVVNMYGITETTVHVTAQDMTPGPVGANASVIGEPLAHLDLVLLDTDGRECPVGMVGEIYVSGSGVATGYLGLPARTRERFVPLRQGERSVRAYRTGDLARRTAAGDLVYCGRADHQVQLRGYRIELGEVESALLRVPGVEQAVVALEQPDTAEPFLAAWIRGADPATVRTALDAVLPAYMQPSRWTQVAAIPMNQNGKPDLPELRRLAAARAPGALTARPLVAVRDPRPDDLAVRIAEVWEEVIQAGSVGPDDHFLHVGGSSMHVMAIHDLLATDPELAAFDVVDLYEYPTPRLLAQYLRETAASPLTKASA